MKDRLKELYDILRTTLDNSKDNSLLLKDYCPWLANFSGNRLKAEIEIPGQYDGKKLPLPQHHVKISGFQTNVIFSFIKQRLHVFMRFYSSRLLF